MLNNKREIELMKNDTVNVLNQNFMRNPFLSKKVPADFLEAPGGHRKAPPNAAQQEID